jgi:pimeloyl-ACP methyl ester carboxylesterase
MASSEPTAAEPFRIAIADAVLDDLRSRLHATRLPAGSADDWNGDINPTYLRALVAWWRDGFDWRAAEARLNVFAHYRASVDGTVVHFIHERGRGPRPLPIVLTHGFPDSFFRFHKLIPLLTDPAAHGGDAADAFDVVAPSLPGYAFSGAPTASGIFGVADVWHALMTRTLGYPRFGAHGGDWGSLVTESLARSHTAALVGIHLTDIPFWHSFRRPDDLSAAEKRFLDAISKWQQKDGAYAMIQGNQPRTTAVGLSDSPAALAAWIVEKFHRWSDCGDDIESRFTKDELLTNVMLYWVTGTAESSLQPYQDVMSAGALRWMTEAARRWLGSAKTPMGFARFAKDIGAPAPREWAERFYNVVRWSEMQRGGHFAALEEPELLAADLRDFFRPLRTSA